MEWLVENGIGETRALLYDQGQAIAARLHVEGEWLAGTVCAATLTQRHKGSRRGRVRLPNGEEALIDTLPQDASEGAAINVAITRAAIAEKGRLKAAQCRTTNAPAHTPSLAEQLATQGLPVRVVRRFRDSAGPDSAWPDSAWDEIFAEGWRGEIAFNGGSLIVSPTPAMTLIDIDGALPAPALALAAVPAIAATLARLDIAGSIGIDFPTLADKADRRAVDEALAAALDHWPHERTAMNGFGFVQIVARLGRMSIAARLAQNRPAAAARLLLRRAEADLPPGILLISANPAVHAAIRPAWAAELTRRTGRNIRWHSDEALALDGGFAQAIAP